MFGQGMRRVGLSGGNRRVQQLHTRRTKWRMKPWRQPTWLISLVSWDRMVTPMMQCSTLSCKHTHTHTHQRQWHTVTHTHSVDRVTEHTPVESAWHLRWRFWRRSHLSDSRTSRVWWSWRTAGSAPGSQTLLTSAAWPDNSTHSSLNNTNKQQHE